MKKQILSTLAFIFSVSLVGAVNAGIILPGGIAVIEDDNVEYVLDAQGNVKTTGNLVVGDTLVSYITFDNVETGGGALVQNLGAPGQELTGISALEVTSAGGNFTFAPSPFLSTYTGYVAGAVAILFEQAAGDFSVACTNGVAGACDTTATNGNHWMTVGFGDADDYWTALALTDDIGVIAAGGAVDQFAFANFGLSILLNNTGRVFLQQQCTAITCPNLGDGLVDVTGNGTVLGGTGLGNDFIARSDFDFQLNVVPEPATIALMGLGLLGLGSVVRRKKRV